MRAVYQLGGDELGSAAVSHAETRLSSGELRRDKSRGAEEQIVDSPP